MFLLTTTRDSSSRFKTGSAAAGIVGAHSLYARPQMKQTHRISLIVAAAVATACEKSVTVPTLDGPSATLNSGDGISVQVKGDGQAELPPGFGNLTFYVHVKQHEDGRAQGRFTQFRSRDGLTVDFDGDVTCIAVDPLNHRAWVGGVITANRSTNPAVQQPIHQPGQAIWFRVLDNSDNETAASRTTTLGFTGSGGIQTSAEYCAKQLWAANDANTFPVVDGYLRIQ
jgi:hypothetical protein